MTVAVDVDVDVHVEVFCARTAEDAASATKVERRIVAGGSRYVGWEERAGFMSKFLSRICDKTGGQRRLIQASGYFWISSVAFALLSSATECLAGETIWIKERIVANATKWNRERDERALLKLGQWV